MRFRPLLIALLLVAVIGLSTTALARTSPQLFTNDIDNDGLPDEVERGRAGADPLHKDVYIEVSYTEGNRPSNEMLEDVRNVFANAPIKNPDGQTGVDVHFDVDRSASEVPVVMTPEDWGLDRAGRTAFDRKGEGYYHVVVVEKIVTPDGDHPAGLHIKGSSQVLVTNQYRQSAETRSFLHELGHAFGIGSTGRNGVDTYDVPYQSYPSVMNYNPAPQGTGPSFSNGSAGPRDHDDWEEIAEELGENVSWS
jgi:hypothetical protein